MNETTTDTQTTTNPNDEKGNEMRSFIVLIVVYSTGSRFVTKAKPPKKFDASHVSRVGLTSEQLKSLDDRR